MAVGTSYLYRLELPLENPHDENWMPYFWSLSMLLAASLNALAAQATPVTLQDRLGALTNAFDGRVGICALDLKDGAPTCVHGDDKYPLQSVMKLVVAAAVFDAVDRGKLILADTIVLHAADASPGPQELANKVRSKGSLAVTIQDLVQLAVTRSDSTSIDALIKKIGGVAVVQDFLKRKTIVGISVDRDERHLQAETVGLAWQDEFADDAKFETAIKALPDQRRDAAWTGYLKDPRDTATPHAMVLFLKALAEGHLLSNASTQALLDTMTATETGSDRLKAGLPKGWSLAHKTGSGRIWKGAISATNDVGILSTSAGNKIAVAVFIANSKRSDVERAGLIAKVAKAVTASYPPDLK